MDRFAEICFALATCWFGLLLLMPTLFVFWTKVA